MEVSLNGKRISKQLILLLLMTLFAFSLLAQPPAKKYSISKGNMVVVLGKTLPDAEIDAFIQQYNLRSLELKSFIRNNFQDSVLRQGWTIMINDPQLIMIAKPMLSIDNIENPGINMQIAVDNQGANNSNLFPANNIQFGYNDFKEGIRFVKNDSLINFMLRKYPKAQKVYLCGNFTDWEKGAIPMLKSDMGWSATVALQPGKYHYKYIVDGNWITDPDNRMVENDMQGNTNSIFTQTNTLIRLDGFEKAKRVFLAGSFNHWKPEELKIYRTDTGWEFPLFLPEGTHTYRFNVDGSWMADPANPDRLPNEFKEFNSVIRIGNPYLFILPGFTNAKQVFLTGSFNQWRNFELPMMPTDSSWQLNYTLGSGNYEFKFFVDGKYYNAEGRLLQDNDPGSIFVLNANHNFRLKGFSQASNVLISGDFNLWSPNSFPMKKDGDVWILPVHLSLGKHLYKFVVDGKWIIDPDNPLWEQNEFNTGNSVIWIE